VVDVIAENWLKMFLNEGSAVLLIPLSNLSDGKVCPNKLVETSE